MTTHTWRDAKRDGETEERYCRCGLRERYVRTADGVSWQWRSADSPEWRERMTGDPRPICTATDSDVRAILASEMSPGRAVGRLTRALRALARHALELRGALDDARSDVERLREERDAAYEQVTSFASLEHQTYCRAEDATRDRDAALARAEQAEGALASVRAAALDASPVEMWSDAIDTATLVRTIATQRADAVAALMRPLGCGECGAPCSPPLDVRCATCGVVGPPEYAQQVARAEQAEGALREALDHELHIAQAVGIVHSPSMGEEHPGPRDAVLRAVCEGSIALAREAERRARGRDDTTWCPHCGPHVDIDEDGTCACGADAHGDGADEAVTALGMVEDLRATLARYSRALRALARHAKRTRASLRESEALLRWLRARAAEADRSTREGERAWHAYTLAADTLESES